MSENGNPIKGILAQIDDARLIPRAEAYVRPTEPWETLRAQLRGAEVVPTPASSSAEFEAIVGREVLALIASEPLSPSTRVAAVRRLVESLESPSSDDIRAVLALLLRG